MKHTLEDIRRVLGTNAILLPVPKGQKASVCKAWQRTTLSETLTEEYQRDLAASDVGVLLGKPGGGICTVDCDDDEAAKAFLEANPTAARTLRTRGARGCNFWFCISGDVPKGCKLRVDGEEIGEWRSTGNQTKIAGAHPITGQDYVWQVDAPAIAISFADICWPEGWNGECIRTPWDLLVDKWGEPFTGTDKGGIRINQKFLVAHFCLEHDVLFERDENRFYRYRPERGLWTIESEARMKSLLLESFTGLAHAQDDEMREKLEPSRTNQLASQLVGLLRGDVERVGAFSIPQRRVHVSNGVVELEPSRLRLRGFSKDDFSRNQLPIDFVPEARCPLFRQLLATALPEDDASLLQRWVGNVLLGGNPGQVMMIQEGTGGTGKSTVASVIEQVIGTENVQELRTGRLAERFEVTRFVGKRLLSGRDVPGDFLSRSGAEVLKALTGGDRLQGEVKGGHGTPEVDGVDVLVSSNSRLRVRLDGDVQAWRRRLLIVTYGGKPPEKPIPDYDRLLIRDEGPGILWWALEGAMAVSRELEQHGRIQRTDRQRQRVEQLLAESDSVRAFVTACLERDPNSEALVDDLKEAYVGYCDVMGWTPVGANEVERQLPDVILQLFGFSKRNDCRRQGRAVRGWKNIRLNVPDAT